MNLRHRQQGMTLWGMIFVVSVVTFIFFIGFKLVIPYKDYYKIRAALDSVTRQAGSGSMSRAEIIEGLGRRFDIDDIRHVNLGNDLTITNRGKFNVIAVQYEQEEHVFGNVYLLMKFSYQKQVATGE